MDQIVKHFTPAMAAYVVGILLIGILVFLCSKDGAVGLQIQSFLTSVISHMTSQLPDAAQIQP